MIFPTLQEVFTALSKSGLSIHSNVAPSLTTLAVGSDINVIFKSAAEIDSTVSAVQGVGGDTICVISSK